MPSLGPHKAQEGNGEDEGEGKRNWGGTGTKEEAVPSRKSRCGMRARGAAAPHYLGRSWAWWAAGVVGNFGFLWIG